MTGRQNKTLRKFLQRPVRKLDKRNWKKLTHKSRGHITYLVSQGKTISDMYQKQGDLDAKSI